MCLKELLQRSLRWRGTFAGESLVCSEEQVAGKLISRLVSVIGSSNYQLSRRDKALLETIVRSPHALNLTTGIRLFLAHIEVV